jgi:hypothetical protein
MRKRAVALAALGMLAAMASCRRPVPNRTQDAGSDAGAPSVGDAARVDIPVVEVPDAATEAPRDTAIEAPGDAATAACPAGIAPLDVCGCGCCGEAMGRACYYPSRGETREEIPNPAGQNCATVGCSYGLRHICCADPGPEVSQAAICAIDTSIEDLSRFTITRRDGDVCTTLELSTTSNILQITGPPGYPFANAWRARCDGSDMRTFAIGGLGTVTPGTLLPVPRFDVHVVLFFDRGTGVAESVRIDRDEVAVASRCTSGVCPPCGATCQLDATYRFTTIGGLAAYRDATILAPPASYTHVRKPEAVMGTEMSCAPAFAACGGASVDVADVMAAVSDPDVRDAFTRSMGAATLPFYGVDDRGADGPASQITRDGGGGFLIGRPCPDAPIGSCTPIPPGLSRLLSTLVALDQQQIADPSCDFSRP